MTGKQKQERIDALFTRAVAISPAARKAFLDQACGADPDGIRTEVERLLRADRVLQGRDEWFLKSPPLETAARLSKADRFALQPGTRFGPYTIQALVGEGGFGDVYLASRVDVYQQDVAIKVARWKMGQYSELRQRFEQERQVLADLDHPHIARILGGGSLPDGRPYMVMEYVRGAPITDYCEQHGLSTRDRLVLFQKVCRAVAHAHRHGVIHRDLKPSNILVTRDMDLGTEADGLASLPGDRPRDGPEPSGNQQKQDQAGQRFSQQGVPKLIDFGIARLTGPATKHRRLATTRMSLLPLTPEYASPEQVRGEPVTTESDVYSLGVVLYELVTDTLPYRLAGLARTNVERTICECTPVPPSKSEKRRAASRSRKAGWGSGFFRTMFRLGAGIHPKWIGRRPGVARTETVSPCREPPRPPRLSNSGEEWDGIGSTTARQCGEPLPLNRPRETGEGRDRGGGAEGLVGAGARVQEDQRPRAEVGDAADAAAGNGRFWRELTGDLDRIVLKALHKDPARRYASPNQLAEDIERHFAGLPVLARPDDVAYRLKKFVGRNRWGVAAALLVALAVVGGAIASAVGFHRATIHRRAAERQLELSRRSVYNLQLSHIAQISERDPRTGLKLLNDPNVCSPRLRDFTWRLFRHFCQPIRATLRGHTDHVLCVAYSPTGKLLASAGKDAVIKLWDPRSGAELATLAGHNDWITTLAFSRDGRHLASAGQDRTIRLWDVDRRKVVATLTGHADMVQAVAFSPAGDWIVSGSADGVVKLWDAATGEERLSFQAHHGHLDRMALSPDGKRLATRKEHGRVKIWSLPDGALRTIETQPWRGSITSLDFGPDGRTLAVAADGDLALVVSDLATGTSREFQGSMKREHDQPIASIDFSPDGRTLATASYDGTLRLWDVASGKAYLLLDGHAGCVRSVAFAPDGRQLASAGHDGTVRIWDVAGEQARTIASEHNGPVFALCLAPDGKRFATGSEDGTIGLWDLRSGKRLKTLHAHAGAVRDLAYSPQGDLLASASFDHTVRLWDVATRRTRHILRGHGDRVQAVAFSPDGSRLASAGRDETVRLWDVESGEMTATLIGHQGRVTSVCFAPDGRTLATASRDGTVRLWDRGTGVLMGTIRQAEPIGSIAFSPDGHSLATGPARLRQDGPCDGTVRLWDVVDSLHVRAECHGHLDEVFSIAYSPDGKTLATASADLTVRLWDAMTGQRRAILRSHRNWVYRVQFSSDGSRLVSAGTEIKVWEGPAPQPVSAMPASGTGVAAGERSEPGDARVPRLSIGDPVQLGEPRKGVTCLGVSPDDRLVAAGRGDGDIVLWDRVSGAKLRTLRGHHATVESLQFSPDGRCVASSSAPGDVRLWRVHDGKLIGHWSRPAFQWPFVEFSPDGSMVVVSGSTDRIVVLDARDLAQRRIVAGGDDVIFSSRVAFSPDGAMLACGTAYGNVKLWNRDTWKRETLPRRHYGGVRSIAFSADGRHMASASADPDRPLVLWDVPARQPIGALRGHNAAVASVAFSPDGKLLCSGGASTDPTIRLWDMTGRQEVARLAGPGPTYDPVAWSHNGRLLFSTSARWGIEIRRVGPLDESSRPVTR